MPLILIPFGVFFACCCAQFFLWRVRRAMVERHPDVWREISGKAWFIDKAVSRFAWKRRDKGLNDPDLTRKVKELKIFGVVTFSAWLVYAVMLVTGLGLP
ncbi:MAG: hypothetical protein J7515_04145 [Caulobacter sp.]|nr:hypothetical protein [Caulobacter sp.]